MPEQQVPTTLFHIPIEREPDIEFERRRKNPPPPPPRVASRAMHGGQIAASVSVTATGITNARRQAGIAPDRLLVVEFSSLSSSAREVFEERFNAAVVDENTEQRKVQRILFSSEHGELVDAVSQRVASISGPEQNPELAGLRLRKANKADIVKAVQAGAQVDRQLIDHPDLLLVIETSRWDTATMSQLQRLGLAQISQAEAKTDITRLLVQFPSTDDVRRFEIEAGHYMREEARQTALPLALRRSFFDALEWAGARTPEDRMGARLRQEGFPSAARFPLDVDLWHPGTNDEAREVLVQFRSLCQRYEGRVLEDLRTSSLVLARVEANRALGQALLSLDLVAQVNLPPTLPVAYSSIFTDVGQLPDHALPTGTEPLVTVIDSGVLSGHPFLRGWILEEVDFNSGENTVVDQHGHGTQVAGLAVYGDIAKCLKSGSWLPQVLVASAKVLRRDPADETRPVFSDERRPEKVVEEAIRHFHRERGCRIFNLSAGSYFDIYSGGRQFAWAEVLDQLARELDIVIVVSAGNIISPPWPQTALVREDFQKELRNLLLQTPDCRLCSPATAAIAVTVGAIARSDRTDRYVAAAAPAGAPAPFSRVGPGYAPKDSQWSVKPEFVAYGGNYAIQNVGGSPPRWVRNDIQLGEPTTRLNSDGGRSLTAVSGTSFAAPQVSYAAALAMKSIEQTFGGTVPTANAARALLGACAQVPPCGGDWLCDSEDNECWEKLRLVGYGRVDINRVVTAVQHDVCLIGQDEVEEDHWHLFAVRVPPSLTSGRGERGIIVSLAFDPPVRSSRRDYVARTMWVEVLKGLSQDEIKIFRSRRSGDAQADSLPQRNLLSMRPARTDVGWSTLQVRRCSWTRAPHFPKLNGQNEPLLHVLVGCQRRFPSGEDPNQRYALAVRFWHSDASVKIYQEIQSRVRIRAVSRIRVDRRG